MAILKASQLPKTTDRTSLNIGVLTPPPAAPAPKLTPRPAAKRQQEPAAEASGYNPAADVTLYEAGRIPLGPKAELVVSVQSYNEGDPKIQMIKRGTGKAWATPKMDRLYAAEAQHLSELIQLCVSWIVENYGE